MKTEQYYFFYRHEFGQWTLKDMVDEGGVEYNCCEQYMMYQKALLFGDTQTARKILEEKDPRNQKALGRTVEGFNEEIWIGKRQLIVYEGNKLKFTQHEDLKRRLLATRPKTLVEASPVDLIWGVGLSARDPLIQDPENWRGQNLLGKTLTKLRGDLIKWNSKK